MIEQSEKIFWSRPFKPQVSKKRWYEKLYSALPYSRNTKSVKHELNDASEIIRISETYVDLPDKKLKEKLKTLADKFALYRENQEDLFLAIALIRESSGRILGMKHHKVQIAAALALAKGHIAEMATGEGKTLSSVIPVILYAWRRRGVHVFTANEYLVKRDAQELSGLYRFCGLSTAFLQQELQTEERIEAYQKDIVYATQKDIAADFLKDSLQLKELKSLNHYLFDKISHQQNIKLLNPKGCHYAVVDEIDSLLIDEADTPLILSGSPPSPDNSQQIKFQEAIQIARNFEEDRDFLISYHQQGRSLNLSQKGKEKLLAQSQDMKGLWQAPKRSEELVCLALQALFLFKNGKDYIIDEGKIVIIDQKTGRLMPDRTWQRGLQQMIEYKEEIELQSNKVTFAKITFQNFFRLYKEISGLTGTASDASAEFFTVYNLKIVKIPLHQKKQRKLLENQIHHNFDSQIQSTLQSVASIIKRQQSLLIAVNTVTESERLAEKLREAGLEFFLLNAKKHREEAEIISKIGLSPSITICTNMAGRGTDINLSPELKKNGGLHIISLSANDSKRVERQLIGRCARQGDPGSFQKIYSLEDPILKENLADVYLTVLPLLNKKLQYYFFEKAIQTAEKKAQHRRLQVEKSNDAFLKKLLR